jgi:hypothetical protein
MQNAQTAKIGTTGQQSGLLRVTLATDFRPLTEACWHFTLEHEPFPGSYFDFEITEELSD